jgi:hypothetical protein
MLLPQTVRKVSTLARCASARDLNMMGARSVAECRRCLPALKLRNSRHQYLQSVIRDGDDGRRACFYLTFSVKARSVPGSCLWVNFRLQLIFALTVSQPLWPSGGAACLRTGLASSPLIHLLPVDEGNVNESLRMRSGKVKNPRTRRDSGVRTPRPRIWGSSFPVNFMIRSIKP